MHTEIANKLRSTIQKPYTELLRACGLTYDTEAQQTVLIWDGEALVATGARQDNVLKYIAVDPAYQGEGLTATVLTHLRQEALAAGHRHLFLYTKPKNKLQFQSLFFYPVARTKDVLLMEDRPNGIRQFLHTLPTPCTTGTIGAAVMNCNPFTLGHQYLAETAAKECDHVYLFILSEDQSQFSPEDRLEMAKLGTAHLPNVTVLPTGPYLISSATFPGYFLKDRDKTQAHCELDIAVFTEHYIPHFHITRRYVGTEPLSPLTQQYNQALKALLPIELRELPRLELQGVPVSASAVRADLSHMKQLVPHSTYTYINTHHLSDIRR